jgi:hypothetical protein
MAIRFRCSACNRRLSIATRKAGTQTACPNCKATVTVPGAAPAPTEPEAANPPGRRLMLVAALTGGVLLLAAGVAVALVVALRKPAEVEQARTEPPAPAPPAPLPQPPAKPPSIRLPGVPLTPAQPPVAPVPNEPPSQQPPSQPPTTSQSQQLAQAPPPHVVVKPPAPQLPLDRFGNPVGQDIGLSQDGEFKGKKLLFWSGFESAGRVFFHPTNPLWKALEAKGFAVRREFGKFNPAWLKEIDQLWVLSTGRLDLPAGITPEALDLAVSLLPLEAVPSGFTLPEYQFVVRATLEVAFSPTHPLDAQALKAIEDFVKAGKGLCLLADDEPFTKEADELARRLFGARVGGNYIADKIATVRGRGLTPAEVRKFGGQFEVDDHPLLTGVNFLFEGITVSHVTKSDKLDVAVRASDGQALVVVSKVPGQRVVIDCGFTRYCHGPTERTSYITKTAGTVRLGQNIAAYLAGKDARK